MASNPVSLQTVAHTQEQSAWVMFGQGYSVSVNFTKNESGQAIQYIMTTPDEEYTWDYHTNAKDQGKALMQLTRIYDHLYNSGELPYDILQAEIG